MDRLDLIKYQFQVTHITTKGMVEDINEEFWYIIPNELKTSIAWLTGHIITGRYEHILIPWSNNVELFKKHLPVLKFIDRLETGSTASEELSDVLTKQELLYNLEQSRMLVSEIFNASTDDTLDEKPLGDFAVADSRGSGITWALQHEMWHVGQIALLRRALGIASGFEWVGQLNGIWNSIGKVNNENR